MSPTNSPTDQQSPDAIGHLAPAVIEGRLTAHRTVLAMILAHLQRAGNAGDIMAVLDTLSVVQDHQEDPGANPDSLDLHQVAVAGEIAEIVLAAAPERLLAAESG